MLGKLSSLGEVVGVLRKNKVCEVIHSRFDYFRRVEHWNI